MLQELVRQDMVFGEEGGCNLFVSFSKFCQYDMAVHIFIRLASLGGGPQAHVHINSKMQI